MTPLEYPLIEWFVVHPISAPNVIHLWRRVIGQFIVIAEGKHHIMQVKYK